VQAGEQEKQKSYLATCWLPCPVTPAILDKINATENLVLQQRTPTRVEHRRAMLVGMHLCMPAHPAAKRHLIALRHILLRPILAQK
jgi:tRNA U54 and U55 pseudouridine synthase Pus10